MGGNGDELCGSEIFNQKCDCLKMLRASQRHAATMHVFDESVV